MNDMAMTRQRPNFAAAPYELVDDETISPQAKAVYLVMDRHADYKTGATFVGKDRVARKCGYSKPDSIDRYLKELKDKGWISWKRRWRRSTGKVDASGRPVYEYSDSTGEGFEPTTNLYTVHDRVATPSTAGIPVPPTAGIGIPPAAGGPVPPTAGTNEKQLNENQLNENQGGASAPVADAPAPKKKSRKKPALPLPEGWTPSERTVQAMAEECPTVDQEKELLAFRDHWWSKDERRASWDATYRNWIRRSAEWSSNKQSRSNVNSLADWGAPSTQQQQPSGQNPFRSIYDEMRAING